jgi:signal transduction histidine kinase
VTVTGNELFASAVRNILNNAVQHNNGEGHVDVSLVQHEEPGVAHLSVAADGPGVPDDRKEEIFGKGEHGLADEGTGIGLYLVHELVDNFSGDIWVEDTDPTGAVFAIEVPLDGR